MRTSEEKIGKAACALLGVAVLAVTVVVGASQAQTQSRHDACGESPTAGCLLELARAAAIQVVYPPDRDRHLRVIAHAQVQAGDNLGAIETAESVFYEPSNVRDHVLADIAVASAARGEAGKAVRIAMSVFPEANWQRKHLLRRVSGALAANGQFEAAVEVAQTAGDHTGNAVDAARLEIVRTLAHRDELDELQQHISKIENPEIKAYARRELALALARSGAVAEAVRIVDTPPLQNPEQTARTLLQIARLADPGKHLTLVISALGAVTALESADPDLPVKGGRSRTALLPRSGPTINRALPELRAEIAVELAKGGQVDRARTVFDQLKSDLRGLDDRTATLHNPNYYNDLTQRFFATVAIAEARAGFYDDAIETARSSHSPTSTKAAIAIEMYRRNDVDRSRALLEQSIADQEAMPSTNRQYFPVLPSTFAAMLETGEVQQADDLFREQLDSYLASERRFPADNAARIAAIQIVLKHFEDAWRVLREAPFSGQTRAAMLNLATTQAMSGDAGGALSQAVRIADANERASLLVAIGTTLVTGAWQPR